MSWSNFVLYSTEATILCIWITAILRIYSICSKKLKKEGLKKNRIFSIKTTWSDAPHLLSSISSLRPEFWPCTAKVENLWWCFLLSKLIFDENRNRNSVVSSQYSLSIIQSMRIQEMITRDQLSWCLHKFPIRSITEIYEYCNENTNVDIGYKGVNFTYNITVGAIRRENKVKSSKQKSQTFWPDNAINWWEIYLNDKVVDSEFRSMWLLYVKSSQVSNNLLMWKEGFPRAL